jgi:superfamily I DNA/RNA helicase
MSTIHKTKGLQCDSVIIMPCDARTFSDNQDARCLLYVALSRAKSRLQLVLSGNHHPSPLLIIKKCELESFPLTKTNEC